MSFLSDRWAVVTESLGAARYGLASVIRYVVAGAALLSLWWFKHEMSGVESVTLGVLILVSFLFLAMLEFCLKLKRQIREGRVEIAGLRKKGVELRNFGQGRITDQAAYEKWVADTLQWERDTTAAIAKISIADAEWFSVMDSYPDKPREPLLKPFSLNGSDKEHSERYAQHDFQVARLGQMIRDLWGRN